MTAPPDEQPILSEARAKGLRRMLLIIVGLAVLLLLMALAAVFGDALRFTVVVGIIGVILLAASLLTLRSLRDRGTLAKRGCLITAILLMVFAVPLAAVIVGLVMVVAGVLLLFLLYTPERETA